MSTNIAGVPIDFGPIVQEPDDVSSITGKYQMPCGCKLTQKVINKGSFGSSVATEEFIDMAKKRLIYWFEKRIPWHQCHLVASENPNGIISKDLRSNRTPPFGYLLESGQVSDVSIEQEIQAKGLTAPRITPADIEAEIVVESYFTARDGVLGALAADGVPATSYEQANAAPQSLSLLTFCVLVLRNGFTVTGESACASPENFDAEIGKKIARANAVQKIWPLMGYALKDRLHANAPKQEARETRAAFFDASVVVKPNQVAAPDKVFASPPATPGIDLDAAVTRFLSWRLPDDFAPDCGINFIRTPLSQPTGTNLLHAGQARAMLEHVPNVAVPMMRDGSPADPEKFGVIVVHTNAPETPPIPAYQQRVLDEKRELDEKLEKLRTFIDGSPVFSGLPVTDQSHLKSQLAVMEVYSCILADRIARFGGAA